MSRFSISALRTAAHLRVFAALCRSTIRGAPPALTDQPARAPWVASIQYDAPNHGCHRWHCATGVLIAPRAVLTCAHVFSPAAQSPGTIPVDDKDFTIRVGGTTLDDGAPYKVTKVHPHPRFEPATGAHDLAVAILESNSVSSPVMLDVVPVELGDSAIVLGWPRGRDGDGRLTRVRTPVLHPLFGPGRFLIANVAEPNSLGVGTSGAPVIRLKPDGAPRLRGILSSGTGNLHLNLGDAGPLGWVVDLASEEAFLQEVLGGEKPCHD